MIKRWFALLIALILTTGLTGCVPLLLEQSSSSSTPAAQTPEAESAGAPADTVSDEPTGEATDAPADGATDVAKDSYGVGERAELDGVAVTLTQVEESEGSSLFTPEEGKIFLLCHFEFENNSDEELSISSLISFDAYVDDYSTGVSLSAAAATSGTQLDGTVAPGKKLAGIIGYEAAKDWSQLEISYKPNLLSNEKLTFTAEREG